MNPVLRPLTALALAAASSLACAHGFSSYATGAFDAAGPGYAAVDFAAGPAVGSPDGAGGDTSPAASMIDAPAVRGHGVGSGAGSGGAGDAGPMPRRRLDAAPGAWDWRGMKAGLFRKLESGWLLGLNYTRPLGGAGSGDRYGMPAPRPEERPAFLRNVRRALVLSMARSF